MITRPLTDFSFSVSMMRDKFSTILSLGNFVDESFVPTWTKTSECDPGLYFFNIDKISPVLALPFKFTHRVVSSFESTSLIVESSIRSRGSLFWPFISFALRDPRSISFSDCICADITSLEFLSAEISPFNVLFLVDTCFHEATQPINRGGECSYPLWHLTRPATQPPGGIMGWRTVSVKTVLVEPVITNAASHHISCITALMLAGFHAIWCGDIRLSICSYLAGFTPCLGLTSLCMVFVSRRLPFRSKRHFVWGLIC